MDCTKNTGVWPGIALPSQTIKHLAFAVYKLQSLSRAKGGIGVMGFGAVMDSDLTCSRLLTETSKTVDYLIHLYQETVLSTHMVDNNVDQALYKQSPALCDGCFSNLINF